MDTQTLTLSPSAAARVAAIASKQAKPAILRLEVEGGGCSGFQYKFGLTEAAQGDDMIAETDGVRLVVDPVSLELVAGCVVDYRQIARRRGVQGRKSQCGLGLRLRVELLGVIRIASFNINGIKARLPRLHRMAGGNAAVGRLPPGNQDAGRGLSRQPSSRRSATRRSGTARRVSTASRSSRSANSRWKCGAVSTAIPKTSIRAISRPMSSVCASPASICPTATRSPARSSTTNCAGWSGCAARMAEIAAEEVPAVVLGDFNVIPEDKDVWSVQAMATMP